MSVVKSNLCLLLAAAIWGFAFVAQRVGMDHMGPFAFNGVRFLLGSLSLVPLILYNRRRAAADTGPVKSALPAGILAGTVLFIGASLQQIGLLYTTAGKAAFITCLYIVLVPILGIFLKQKTTVSTWGGCLLAIAGLYFLCVKDSLAIEYGDLLELIGALFWATHILLIDHFSRRVDVLKLSCFQFAACALLSLATALLTETNTLDGLIATAVPILYGGLCSVGIAYTLQVVGQQYAPPAHAAIILSMETVFAVIGGFLFLGEVMGIREIGGCVLMLAGMLLAQLAAILPGSKETPAAEPAGK